MTLTVETGAGLATADALISLAGFKARADALGRVYDGVYEDEAIEQAIRRGTNHTCNSFGWQGFRTNARGQSLAFPRSGMVDSEGNGIDSDEIPIEVVNAVFELSWQELSDPFSLDPVFTSTGLVKSEKVGSLAVEYALTNTSADGARPVLLTVRDMVSQFLAFGSGSSIAGTSYRV